MMLLNPARHAKNALRRYIQRHDPMPYLRPRYRFSDERGGDYGILSAAPPIFYVPYWVNEQLVLHQSLTPLFNSLRNTCAYFLYCWFWWIEEPSRVAVVKRFEQVHRWRYPKHQFIHLCNTLRQYEVFRAHGLNAVFCNHNAFVDDRLFIPLPGSRKTWDAVYDARFKDYKRHELAAQLSSLALIYDVNLLVDDPAYVETVRQQFAHAHLFNHAADGAYRHLGPSEVNQCLNACRVGLCLSAVEGANYASIQYLLSGIPVVSTRSRGGRDIFFDNEYVLIVDDTPDAVRAGVAEMIGRNPVPERIRARTLDKLNAHRQTLIHSVQQIYDKERAPRRFESEWDEVFFNKLIRHQLYAETFLRIKNARRT